MEELVKQLEILLGKMVLEQASRSEFESLIIKKVEQGVCCSKMEGQLFGIVGALAGVVKGLADEAEMPIQQLTDMLKFAAMVMNENNVLVADKEICKSSEDFMKMFNSLFKQEKENK